MSAINPLGSQTYWFNGLPFQGVKSTSADTTTLKYWFNGLPADALFPAEGGPTESRVASTGLWL